MYGQNDDKTISRLGATGDALKTTGSGGGGGGGGSEVQYDNGEVIGAAEPTGTAIAFEDAAGGGAMFVPSGRVISTHFRPLDIAIIDANGNHLNRTVTEHEHNGAWFGSDGNGVLAIFRREDNPTTDATTGNGNKSLARVNRKGAQYVQALDSAGNAVNPQGAVSSSSGTIATGGTAQTALAANTSRRFLQITSPSTDGTGSPITESLWVNLTGAAAVNGAATGSIELPPGETLTYEGNFVPTNAVSVVASTAGHPFTVYGG